MHSCYLWNRWWEFGFQFSGDVHFFRIIFIQHEVVTEGPFSNMRKSAAPIVSLHADPVIVSSANEMCKSQALTSYASRYVSSANEMCKSQALTSYDLGQGRIFGQYLRFLGQRLISCLGIWWHALDPVGN